MDEETQKRIITLTSAGIAWGLTRFLTGRLIHMPERPGIKDDLKEQVLRMGISLVATTVASAVVRYIINRYWD
jgi:hypothetical protein